LSILNNISILVEDGGQQVDHLHVMIWAHLPVGIRRRDQVTGDCRIIVVRCPIETAAYHGDLFAGQVLQDGVGRGGPAAGMGFAFAPEIGHFARWTGLGGAGIGPFRGFFQGSQRPVIRLGLHFFHRNIALRQGRHRSETEGQQQTTEIQYPFT